MQLHFDWQVKVGSSRLLRSVQSNDDTLGWLIRNHLGSMSLPRGVHVHHLRAGSEDKGLASASNELQSTG